MQFVFPQFVCWTISELTDFLRSLLTVDELQDLWVTGEVSNSTRSTAGHFYFTLKDSRAALRCVMWRQQVNSLRALPQDGDLVQAHGYLDIYPPNGQYQLYADTLIPLGAGALFQEFLRLKTQLEQEGLFDPARKKNLPLYPHQIGIVTSLKAAALQDILNTLRRRYPLAEVVIAPALVQGEDAPPTLIRALLYLDQEIKPDVIILARGGGSIEDLWAFNDEYLSRTIASLQTPIVTGIGHETDFTLADFAADLRAPTPTAAAEIITPNIVDLKQTLEHQSQQLSQAMISHLSNFKFEYQSILHRLKMVSPSLQTRIYRQRLDELQHRLRFGEAHQFDQKQTALQSLYHRLTALNPTSILARGYAVIHTTHGDIVRSVSQVSLGDPLDVRLADGSMDVKVMNITIGNNSDG